MLSRSWFLNPGKGLCASANRCPLDCLQLYFACKWHKTWPDRQHSLIIMFNIAKKISLHSDQLVDSFYAEENTCIVSKYHTFPYNDQNKLNKRTTGFLWHRRPFVSMLVPNRHSHQFLFSALSPLLYPLNHLLMETVPVFTVFTQSKHAMTLSSTVKFPLCFPYSKKDADVIHSWGNSCKY